jgi:AcrR family transcriptional regulator
MPRPGLDPERVARVAADIADRDGLDRLSLSAVAEALGVKTPSLYNHVQSLESLRESIAELSRRELGDVLSRCAVGRSGADALTEMGQAYRRWGLAHPGRLAATVRAVPGQTEVRAPDPLDTVLSHVGLDGVDGVHAARALRASVHGFTVLEAAGGFGIPVDIEASFERMLDLVVRGIFASEGTDQSERMWNPP